MIGRMALETVQFRYFRKYGGILEIGTGSMYRALGGTADCDRKYGNRGMTEYEEFKKMAALRDRGGLFDGNGL